MSEYILLGIKTKLDLSINQKVLMSKHAGIKRFTFNWGLATWQELYKSGCKFNYRTLRTFFNKYLKAEYTWIKEKGIYQKVTLRVRHFDGTETDTAEWSH